MSDTKLKVLAAMLAGLLVLGLAMIPVTGLTLSLAHWITSIAIGLAFLANLRWPSRAMRGLVVAGALASAVLAIAVLLETRARDARQAELTARTAAVTLRIDDIKRRTEALEQEWRANPAPRDPGEVRRLQETTAALRKDSDAVQKELDALSKRVPRAGKP